MDNTETQYLTIHTPSLVDILVTEAGEDVYRYIVYLAHRRHPKDKIYVLNSDHSKTELNADEINGNSPHKVIYLSEKLDVVHHKVCKHKFVDNKIVSEFYNTGKKTHSSEISIDVAQTLLRTLKRDSDEDIKTQIDQDDNNFWKNPVNQTQQTAFAEDTKSLAIKYGGQITREEVG